ncbi:MAG: hypothetical protein IT464_12880 [Planctomycetes bacterium]|nr:hypothetical protein [Planctomycetota bacterium]
MQPQDAILSIGAWVFIAALLPSLARGKRPSAMSSFLTAGVLLAYASVYASLGLWASGASSALLALLWAVLCVLKLREGPHAK